MATGNKYQYDLDYLGAGPFPLQYARTYNSQQYGGGSVGYGWRSSYDGSISVVGNIASVYRPNGKVITFTLTNGVWVQESDINDRLVQLANATGWQYFTADNTIGTYNANGGLISLTNRAGLTQTYVLSDGTAGPNGGYFLDANGNPTATILPAGYRIRVTDPFGRSISFGYGYDSTNTIIHRVTMTDAAGGNYLYGYDTNNNLTSVTYPDSTTRTYLYGEAANVSATPAAGVSYTHSLTGILDETGTRYASWTYDAKGRATSSEHGSFGSGIDHVGLVYSTPDASGNSTTAVTDPRGNTRSYTFSTLFGVIKNTSITGQPCNGCNAALGYDANGNIASRTDFNGNTTCYTYDLAHNLEILRLEGLSSGKACPADLATYIPATAAGSVERKITTQWDATYRLPTVVAEPLRITSNSYDTSGNLLTRAIQPTSDATGAQGLSATVAGTARVNNYTYNSFGQILTVDGPRTDIADITRNTYDTQGNLVTVNNPINHATTLGNYDAHGHPGTITGPNGLITSLAYDPRGRLTSRSAGGETTSYTYDGAGQLITVTTPGGAAYSYSYDAAHRLTGIADNLGNRIVYTLDVMGNRTSEQTFDAYGNIIQTHRRVFDALNRLYRDIGAVNQTTTYAYDANGNLTSTTDPLNRLTDYAYDALNRLTASLDAADVISLYGYDGLDQLVSVTDPRALTTQYWRDGLGNLNQQTSPDTGITSHTYDAAGNMLTRTDAKGQLATYSYDALNRLTGITYTGGAAPAQTGSYQYDQGTNGIGHLTRIVDSTGTTSYSYDPHGRLTTETRQPSASANVSYTTAYSYDIQGRLSGIVYPSGRSVDYGHDGMGRTNRITTTFNGIARVIASNIVYEPFGGVHGFTYGDGTTSPVQTYVRQRDQDGRIASYTLGGRALTLSYDAASQIVTLENPLLFSTALYHYDVLGRLTGYSKGTINHSYNYDPNGNRASQMVGSTLSTYGYPANSNRLTAIQTGATTQSISHDPNGATTSDATRQYSYDIRGRLIQTDTAQGVINYEVNALGLRTRKQVPNASLDTTYHYDLKGHLIGESPTGSSQFTREYIYLNDQPVAVMQ